MAGPQDAEFDVGVVGLGAMGQPIACRLAGAGHRVAVFDVRAAAAAAPQARGARTISSPGELARRSEAVITCLPTVEAVRDVVLEGDQAIARQLAPGALLIQMSTVSIGLTREIATALGERRVQLLDAPFTQATGRPEDGALTIMLGGEDAAVERVRPLLETIAAKLVPLGPSGAATATKLATQYAGVCNLLAAAEAILLARENGASVERLGELAPSSIAQSRMFELASRWLGRDPEGPPPDLPKGALRILAKDVHLAVEAAAEGTARHDLGSACDAVLAEAVERGLGDRDFLELLDLLADR